ncbi:TonB family protein [Reichenbachiella sp. MALMAid0571]|uniref:TonB family protein n=1 Tax=Reichenbachiella sp. MALMAid0571 TaxID=3143939 RepID=UPI0032E00205
MNIFNNDIDHLSIEEIRAYLDNQMSNKEMHDFERHLLDCELCNDAFEGYQASGISFENETREHLRSIVTSHSKTKKYPNMAIAASVVILLCASIVFLFSYFEKDSTKVSMAEKEKEESITAPLELEDSVESIKNEVIEEEPEKTQKKHKVSKVLPRTEPKIVIPQKVTKEELSDETALLDNSDSFLEETVNEEIVSDDKKNVVSFSDSQPEKLTGETERFEITSAKSRIKKETFAQRSLAAPLSMKKSESSLLAQNALPVVGIDSYKLYLKDSLRYPESAKRNQLTGQVVLRFEVKEEGEINDLTVEKGLSTECDLEAKRLVLEGSKWVLIDKNLPAEKNVVNLTVEFTLK